MSSTRATTLLLFAALALAACKVTIQGAGHTAPRDDYPVPSGNHAAAIQASANVAFSSDRAGSLSRLAAEPGLSQDEQLYLVHVVATSGGFSDDKADVLVTLLDNPAVTVRTKKAIADALPGMDLFSSDELRVVERM